MPSLLIRNIRKLAGIESAPAGPRRGADLAILPAIRSAFLLVENGKIARFGPMSECPDRADEVVEADGRIVLPAWCDSHTHLVFAGTREREFVDRIQGLSYEEIARRGGGILNSAKKLRATPEPVLLEQAQARLDEIRGFGTGAVEIKSGYGLSTESELKMLRVIRQLKETNDLPVKATILGAHALPFEYKTNREGYIQLIINEMLPKIAGEGLADYLDVFCEKVAFSVEETERLIEAGARYGLKAKIHTNQFNCMGGIEVSVKHGAVSVDHLEVVNDAEIECLRHSNTIATLLPSAPFFLNDPYPPARKIIDADIAVALATDYNPGSSPSGKVPFVLSLACVKMKMLPEEAINAATLNGAYALELEKECGSIAAGKRANFILTRPVPSLAFLHYAFGSDWIERVFINGK